MAKRRPKQIPGQGEMFPQVGPVRATPSANVKGRTRFGRTARSSDMGAGPDMDTTSVRRRIHEAVATWDDEIDDWEDAEFSSTRVASARYSQSRQQLFVTWSNGYVPYVYDGVPPAVWTGFRTAGSAGRYVNHTLNTFPYRPAPGEG